jgi:hypothetical protein
MEMFPGEIDGLAVGEMSAADFISSYPVTDPRDESPLDGPARETWNARYNLVTYEALNDWLRQKYPSQVP